MTETYCVKCDDTGERHYFDFNEPCGLCRKGCNRYLAGLSLDSREEFLERIKGLTWIENDHKDESCSF